MTRCLFASDLHGHADRYAKIWDAVRRRRPRFVFLGGDLLPNTFAPLPEDAAPGDDDFVRGFLASRLRALRQELANAFPEIFVVLGNDDPRVAESAFLELTEQGLCTYAHDRRFQRDRVTIYGYACVPPTPFFLKDWERYDVSRYVDPGCISPEEGTRTVSMPAHEVRHGTIAKDLEALIGDHSLDDAVLLFHTPPYQTRLDRAGMDGKRVDHVPVDVHVGSIAVRRLIEERQPVVTLHGHVHESVRLTGSWRDRIGRTHLFGAAHDGPELALVDFDFEEPENARRELL